MKKLLVVDDTPIQLKIVISIMQREGFQVDVAQSGKEALESIQKNRPDLILLDIVMPDMDGFVVCEAIKNNPESAEIPILFLTGQDDEDQIVRAFEMGAADFVAKPVNPPELLARVHTHLKLATTIQELQSALDEVKRLSGLLRICTYCKSIEHESNWIPLEDYLFLNTDARLTHCVCPECLQRNS